MNDVAYEDRDMRARAGDALVESYAKIKGKNEGLSTKTCVGRAFATLDNANPLGSWR